MRSGQQRVTHDPSTYIPVVRLTTAELERFRKNAPAALALRGAGFVLEQLACSGEAVLTGLVPLVGVLAYDWSAPALVVFLLVGIWTAIVCDFFKYAVLRAAVASEARELEDHRRVWLVVDALRNDQKEGRAVIAKYPPGVGLFVDVALGSVSTVMLVIVLIANGWFILLGVLYGLNMVLVLRETAWLRAYLQRGRGGRNRRTS